MKLLHVLRVELIPQSEIGRKNLHPQEVVPGHACLGKHSGEALEEKIQFPFHPRRSYAGYGIDPNPPGDVERIVHENGVAKRKICGAIRKVNAATPTIGWRRHKTQRPKSTATMGFCVNRDGLCILCVGNRFVGQGYQLQRTRIEPIQPWPTFVMKEDTNLACMVI